MPRAKGRRRAGGVACLLAIGVALVLPSPAPAAGAPILGGTWANEVVATSARLHTDVNPNAAITFYRFDYITAAAYEANLKAAKDGFAGAKKAPTGTEPSVGAGTTPIPVTQRLSSLAPETSYRYRAVAKSSAGTAESAPLTFTTQGFAGTALLPDNRGWEMVSPVEKNGGQVNAPGTLAGGGVLQGASGGAVVTFSSAASFGAGAEGAPAGSQYIARRTSGGWTTENITTPMLSGSYGSGPVGVPYRIFSADLSRGLLLSGRHCRGDEGEDCPVANPPLAGTGAPAGYQNYYLRQSSPPGFQALLGSSALAYTPLSSSQFDLELAGATEDLKQVVLSSCAALTPNATEAPGEAGSCDPEAPNLYRWSGGGFSLLNLLPAQSIGAPGATLAAQSGAISAAGSRVYFSQGGNLYLREGASTRQVDADAGAGGNFQTASGDGAVAFFLAAGHLYRYQASSDSATDLTPGGEALGVLGASLDGAYVYYRSTAGLFVRHGATTTKVAADADATNYPPTTGTARVSADGTRLAFLATTPLGSYDNTDQKTAEADSQLYLYEASSDSLRCISCNPTGARPLGPSSIPGARRNGTLAGSPRSYKPRAMVAEGRRLFFDSADDLVLGDTNGAPDVYEWEAQGTGDCARAAGCLGLISNGKSSEGASFVDASADGSDAFFLTASSLVPADPGSFDLYDARIGGGFPVPLTPIPCAGDACQGLPSEPEDRPVTTLIAGPGNPAVRYPKRHGKKHNGKRKKKKEAKQKRQHGKSKHGAKRRGKR